MTDPNSIEAHLNAAHTVMSRTMRHVTATGIKVEDVGAALSHLVAVSEHAAEFAALVENATDDLPPDHALNAIEGLITRLAIGHITPIIDGAIMLASYVKRDIENIAS
jgi:hypothetical protein